MVIEEVEISWQIEGRRHRARLAAEGFVLLPVEGPILDVPLDAAERPPAVAAVPPTPPAEPGGTGGGATPQLARKGKAWSDGEEEELRRAFVADEPSRDIARRLGRSHGAVVARLVRMGLLDEALAGLRYPVKRPEPRAGEGG
jgi:hypothetical protein